MGQGQAVTERFRSLSEAEGEVRPTELGQRRPEGVPATSCKNPSIRTNAPKASVSGLFIALQRIVQIAKIA